MNNIFGSHVLSSTMKDDHHCWFNRLSYDIWKNAIISHEPVKMGARAWRSKARTHYQQYDFNFFHISFFFFSHFGSSIHIHYKLILGRLRMNENIFFSRGRQRENGIVESGRCIARGCAQGFGKIGRVQAFSGKYKNECAQKWFGHKIKD